MLKEFKEFAMRGNVMDLAVGVIIGAAFGKIVSSFVEDVLMPPIGRLLGRVDFSGLFINLSGKTYETLAGSTNESPHKKTGASTGTDHQRLPPVRDDDSTRGEALRPLHDAARLTT